jgi:hypothetical protein
LTLSSCDAITILYLLFDSWSLNFMKWVLSLALEFLTHSVAVFSLLANREQSREFSLFWPRLLNYQLASPASTTGYFQSQSANTLAAPSPSVHCFLSLSAGRHLIARSYQKRQHHPNKRRSRLALSLQSQSNHWQTKQLYPAAKAAAAVISAFCQQIPHQNRFIDQNARHDQRCECLSSLIPKENCQWSSTFFWPGRCPDHANTARRTHPPLLPDGLDAGQRRWNGRCLWRCHLRVFHRRPEREADRVSWQASRLLIAFFHSMQEGTLCGWRLRRQSPEAAF